MRAFLSHRSVNGTVFEALRNPDVFAQVKVVMGTVQRPNGANLAPDAMYDAIRQDGFWAPDTGTG